MTACYASTVSRTCWHALVLVATKECPQPWTFFMVWWTIQLASLLVNWDEDEKSFKYIPEQLTKCGLGAKHSFQNRWEANQNWLRFTCARSSGGMSIASLWFARRPSTSSTCCESEEENKVRRLCCDGCHWENSTLKKYMYGTTARRKKKSKTVKPL